MHYLWIKVIKNALIIYILVSVITDPLADVMGFISKYREQYGSQPVFYQGTYAQAVNDAKRELRFLLVYLHSDNHADTALFCR